MLRAFPFAWEAGKDYGLMLRAFPFPCEAGKDYGLMLRAFPFPCEAGEGAEGGWGQSLQETDRCSRIKRCSLRLQLPTDTNVA
jgi:hypothetical protein